MIKIYYTRWPKSNNKDFDINWSDPEVDKKNNMTVDDLILWNIVHIRL